MDLVNVSSPPASVDGPDTPVSGEPVTIDPDDEQAVPAALARLVESARFALRAVEVNAIYTPADAVTAMEQTTAVLHRLAGHFDLYVGDFSKTAATSMGRARDLLRQTRSELSDTRNDLALDGESTMTATVAV
jgi:hypothetical protein